MGKALHAACGAGGWLMRFKGCKGRRFGRSGERCNW